MRVIIAGGGTGGHLFPGIAIAEELTMREKTNRVLFVGTVAGLEARVLPRMNIPLRTMTVRGIKGKSLIYRLRALTGIPRAVFEAFAIIRDFNPDLVIGLGAYVSGPMLVAAFLAGVRRVIQEQNVIPGAANRIAAHLANRVFISFEETRSYFAPEKVVVTGNPIRKEFLQLREIEGKEKFGLLVFGGSRGAHRINVAMMDSLEFLTVLKPDLEIVHQAGTDDAPQVAQAYKKRGFRAQVEPFIEDMVSRYRESNLVICRAGATTIAELTASGRASILIPYPFAANNHQEINARNLGRRGAAKVVLDRDLSGERLATLISSLFNNPQEIKGMEKVSASLGKPDAAKRVVDECYRMVG